VWSADSGELIKTLSFDKHAFVLADTVAVGASPRGELLVTLSTNGCGRVWSAEGLEPLGELRVKEPMNQGGSLQLSADGARLVVPTSDGRAHVFDLAGGKPKELAVLGVSGQSVARVSLSPAGDAVALGRSDGIIELWNVAAGGRVALPGDAARPNTLCFSPDGAKLLAAGEDDAVRVWRTSGGEPLVLREERTISDRAAVTLGAPPPSDPWEPWNGFTAAQFSADGSWIAAGSAVGHLVLWDAASGRQLLRITPFREMGRVLALEFAPDGARLAASSEYGTAVVVELGR
jgi:WD40 repeat protein